MIKERIRSNFYGAFLISKLHQVESFILPRIVTDEKTIREQFKKRMGRELDLENPQTFSEKLNWYKLNARYPLMQVCADKYAVREYVSECGYDDLLNELYGVWDSARDIQLSELPERFVLKATHGSHMGVTWPDTPYSWRQVCILLNSWLNQDIYWSGREWVYQNIPRRIIAERFLQDETGELRDFKFFTFNGAPRMVQVDVGRHTNHHVRNFYDMDWRPLGISDNVGSDFTVHVECPKRFADMASMAAELAKPFQQVRVDLYEVDGSVYFGEMTFFHNGGYLKSESEEWDNTIGSWWELVK